MPLAAFRHLQGGGAIDPIEALVIDRDCVVPPEQEVQHAVSGAVIPVLNHGANLLKERRIISPTKSITNSRTSAANQAACAPLTISARCLQFLHDGAANGRAYHFFELMYFKASMSIAWFATIRLSRAFSSSSCFIRTRSLTSRPPYLAFQFRKVFG